MLYLAHNPQYISKLYEEQKEVLGWRNPPLSLGKPSKAEVIKETLQLQSPIYSILR